MRVRTVFHTETVAELLCGSSSLGHVARGRFKEMKGGAASIVGREWFVLGFEDYGFKTVDAAAQALIKAHAQFNNWEESLETVARNEYAIDIRRGEKYGRKRAVKEFRRAVRSAKKDARVLGKRVIISRMVQPI